MRAVEDVLSLVGRKVATCSNKLGLWRQGEQPVTGLIDDVLLGRLVFTVRSEQVPVGQRATITECWKK